MLLSFLARVSFLFIFSTFYFFLSIPKTKPSVVEILRAAWKDFPFYLGVLIIVQIIYVGCFYFKRAMQSSEQLKVLWKIVFALLILADIGVYSIVFHPLVRPVFGGGVVTKVNLMAKDQASLVLIEQATGVQFAGNKSETVYIIHSSDSAYYLTKKYELNYLSSEFESMILHENIYRIQKELISGYEIIGFN